MTTPTTPTNLDIALRWLWRPDVEGGYVNDPIDRGGKTKYGISERQYRGLDIENLTAEQAREIYRRDYWNANNLDAFPMPLCLLLFDALVQHQPRTAISLLQRALRVPGDGLIGPVTIKAAHRAMRRDAGIDAVTNTLALRAHLYAGLVTADSTQARFLYGWLRRLFLLQAFIYQETSKP